MKIRILRPMVVLGQPRAIGDVVDGVQANLANYLIAIRKAAPVAEKDAGKASERQTATAPKPATAEGKAA